MSMMALMLRLVQMCVLVLTDTKIGNFMVLGYGGEPPLTFICSRDVHIQSYNITNYERILSHNRGSSLQTADAFPVVTSLPPFRRGRSDDRKCVCCSQATEVASIVTSWYPR